MSPVGHSHLRNECWSDSCFVVFQKIEIRLLIGVNQVYLKKSFLSYKRSFLKLNIQTENLEPVFVKYHFFWDRRLMNRGIQLRPINNFMIRLIHCPLTHLGVRVICASMRIFDKYIDTETVRRCWEPLEYQDSESGLLFGNFGVQHHFN